MYKFMSTYEIISRFSITVTVLLLSLSSPSSAVEVCNFNLNSMCYLPSRFVGIVDTQFYEKFVDADGVPVMGSVEVADATLMNFAKLIKNMMQHLQADIRQALIERKTRVAVLARGDSFCRIPEISYHHYLSPGKPCSQPGAYGVTFKNLIIVTEGDEGCDHRGSLKAGRVLLHEFAHAINFAIDEKPMDYMKKTLDENYQNALDTGLLSGLKDNGRPHYFTWGFMSYINANECHPNYGADRERLCTRAEFQTFDPRLYVLIQSVLPTLNWSYTCDDVCDPTKIVKSTCTV